jgi:hypothetical protein
MGPSHPPFSPEVISMAITKMFRASGLARIKGARLGLHYLARLEKVSPSQSIIEDEDRTAFISGSRLTWAQQALINVNPYGIAVPRIPAMAGFLREDLGLPVETDIHFFANRAQISQRPAGERKESNARHPWPIYLLMCMEAAANVDLRVLQSRARGFPGYNGLACDGPSPLVNMLSHVRIQVELIQRLLRCRNIPMVVDMARTWMVASFWASGREADASGMSVEEYRQGAPRKSEWEPRLILDSAYPPLQETATEMKSVPGIRLEIDISKDGRLFTQVWVPNIRLWRFSAPKRYIGRRNGQHLAWATNLSSPPCVHRVVFNPSPPTQSSLTMTRRGFATPNWPGLWDISSRGRCSPGFP